MVFKTQMPIQDITKASLCIKLYHEWIEEKIKVYEDKNEVNNAAILCEKGFTNPLFVNYTELFRIGKMALYWL